MSLANAMSRLFNSQRASDGYAATISRGVTSCPATIVLGDGRQVATREQEFAIEADSQDLFIGAADYKPTGTVSLPALNDRITATIRGVSMTWRVVVRGDGQTYSGVDAEETELRVFTKKF